MPEPRRFVVVGAGPQSKVVIDILRACGGVVFGLLDDDASKVGAKVLSAPILGSVQWGIDSLPSDVDFFVAIGGNTPRVNVANRLRNATRRLAVAIHPSAVIASGTTIGSNVLVCAQAVVGVETHLGDDCVINTSASVDHESVIGAGAYLAPGVHTAGQVHVGAEAFVGAGATLGPQVRVGDGAIVGADSLVLRDVPSRMVVWGRPARIVREVETPVNWSALLGGGRRT